MLKRRIFWLSSFALTLILWAFLVRHLMFAHQTYQRDSFQLFDQTTTENYVQSFWQPNARDVERIPRMIPTGLFIQSIAWRDAHSFFASGYIWQHYSQRNKNLSHGFILPEAVELEQREAYRISFDDGSETVGWYFEAKINQKFDYAKYPFDHKTIRLRIWHQDLDQRALLIPYFASYDRMDRDGIFGLDPQISLAGYDILATYFRFQHANYDTNFGFTSFQAKKEFPELYFNIVLRRDVFDAVIIHILPLIAVFVLCFSSLLSSTFDAKRRDIYNFRFLEILTQSAALFFVLLLAHINLREGFFGTGVLYLEYFYALVYVSIIYLTINAYFVVHAEFSSYRFYRIIRYQDNLIPKVIFLPLFSALILAISLAFF